MTLEAPARSPGEMAPGHHRPGTTAVNDEERRLLAASVQMLARLSLTGVPFRELVARRTDVGVTPGGAPVLPTVVDFLSWTDQIARIASQRDLHAPRRGLWLSGRMSPRAQYGLSELGWAIHEAPTLTGAR